MENLYGSNNPNILDNYGATGLDSDGLKTDGSTKTNVSPKTNSLVRKAPVPKEPPRYDSVDIAFVFVVPVLGFLFIKLAAAPALTQANMGAGISVFTLCFVVGVLIWLMKNGVKPSRSAWLGLAVVLLTGAYFSIYQNIVIQLLALPLLMALAAYAVTLLGERRIDKGAGDYLHFDLYGALLAIPFSNFGKLLAICGDRMSKIKKSRNVLMVLLGLVIALPVAIYVGSLLQSADAAFELVWRSFIGRFKLDDIVVTICQITISIPVSMYLFGMVYGTVKHRGEPHMSREEAEGTAEKAKLLPLYLMIGGVTPLLVLYLIFFFSQTAYFLSAFRGVLPRGLIYSEYARRGFFELCNVCVVNLIVTAMLGLFTKDNKNSLISRVYGCLLALFSMAMIVMSLSKMLMYINVYGLTPLRVYTSWFMVFLFLLFAMVIVKHIRPGFHLLKYCVCCGVVMFLLLGYADSDRIIAEYNVEAYRSGKVEELDVRQLNELGSAAAPYLLSILTDENMPDEYRRQAGDALYARIQSIGRRGEYKRDDWRSATIAGYREKKLLTENKERIQGFRHAQGFRH